MGNANNSNLPTLKEKYFTSEVLKKAIGNLRRGATGIAISGKSQLILSGSRLFQSMINLNFYETLKEEWEAFERKGRIPDDYENSEQHHACLQEILNFIDEDMPDKTRFSFIKKLFLIISTEEISNRESILPQQYMRICRTLTSGEILVLLGNYRFALQGSWKPDDKNAHSWLKNIATASDLKYPELVSIYETNLIDKGLISERTLSDRSGFRRTKFYRLTELGAEICRFIEAYDQDIIAEADMGGKSKSPA